MFSMKVLQSVLNRHANVPVAHTLLCASPFSSTRTPSSLSSSKYFLYPVVAVFINRFALRNCPREVSLHFMNHLCTNPQRLYALCRVLALGGPEWYPEGHHKQSLLDLARLDPTHDIWMSRAHYMAMEPRDWPYLCLVEKELQDEEIIAQVKKALITSLAVLDEFFTSVDLCSIHA